MIPMTDYSTYETVGARFWWIAIDRPLVATTIMTAFNDLPLEMLPGIVQNIVQPSSLALICLVSKTVCKFTQPFLYHTITVLPWHRKVEKVLHFKLSCRAPESI
jgi:hypothetical protein